MVGLGGDEERLLDRYHEALRSDYDLDDVELPATIVS
jgi:hypothetical protein